MPRRSRKTPKQDIVAIDLPGDENSSNQQIVAIGLPGDENSTNQQIVAVDHPGNENSTNQQIAAIDHPGDENSSNQESHHKFSQASKGQKAKASRSLKEALTSFQDQPHLIKMSSCIANTLSDKKKMEQPYIQTFELCMEDLWTCMDQKKESDYTCLNPLWFSMLIHLDDNSRILKWIKAKKIFTRRYVFVPIFKWRHWSLLMLCNFGETKYLGAEKGPRMLLLDSSLEKAEAERLQPFINRFVVDILKFEEREEFEQFINEVELEFPEVPRSQRSGEDCGMYVVYFIYCFLVIEKLGEDLSKPDALFDPEELKILEGIRRDILSYQQEKINAKAVPHKVKRMKKLQTRSHGKFAPIKQNNVLFKGQHGTSSTNKPESRLHR